MKQSTGSDGSHTTAQTPKAAWVKILAWVLTSAICSCSGSNFAGSTGTKADSDTNAAGEGPSGNGSGTQGTLGNPSGGNTGGVGSGSGGNNNAANNSCSQGCCPSQNIAFVDCSGGTPGAVNKGDFTVTAVACSAVESGASALTGFDTVFYYGPTDYNSTSKLPPGVDAALNGGAKVIAHLAPGAASLDNPFYSLTLEQNIEFTSNVGGSSITAPNTNAMNAAFSQKSYAGATFNYLMFLGPFLLVNTSLYSKEVEANWCSDLVARSSLGVQQTSFHGYLLDDASRKGLLIATTLSVPNNNTGFDFTDSFVAAELSQKWNSAGASAQCGLPCGSATSSAANGGGNGVNTVGNGTVPGFTNATGVGKPVIYLYPAHEEDVTVKLAFDGKLVTTYPRYDTVLGGWQVHATPQGQLFDLSAKGHGTEYSYIYWNGMTQAFVPDFKDGFVVKGEDSRSFLQTKLAGLGLSPREANDMIVYWLPYMERNPYNLVHFAQSEYTRLAKMDITPKPDALLRVFMVFKSLPAPVQIAPQTLPSFQRHGFTAVEWGGTEIGGDWHLIQ